MIQNLAGVGSSLDAWVTQVEKVSVKEYRKEVLSLLKAFVYTTPQGSGRAAANWRVGINAPDLTWDPGMGEQPEIVEKKDGSGYYEKWAQKRSMGDPKWAEESIKYAMPTIRKIKMGDTVFFSNNVQGDDDNGQTESENYLAELQDQSYWSQKLRLVNMPYVTAAEVLLIHSWSSFADGGSTFLEDLLA